MKWIGLAMAMTLCAAGSAARAADKQPAAPAAPLPTEIQTAHTVFLSSLCYADPDTCSDVYNGMYAGLQKQGRYSVVLSPAQADLIFEIHYTTRLTDVSGSSESGPMSSSSTSLQLVIVDRTTHVALWSITEPESRKIRAADHVLSDLSKLGESATTSTKH